MGDAHFRSMRKCSLDFYPTTTASTPRRSPYVPMSGDEHEDTLQVESGLGLAAVRAGRAGKFTSRATHLIIYKTKELSAVTH